MLITLTIPLIFYERCIPFLCIYVIAIQGNRYDTTQKEHSNIGRPLAIVCVLLSIFLVVDRNYLVARSLLSKLDLHIHGDDFPGIGIQHINRIENIREANIVDRLAGDGNCLSNSLGISSCAVWFCRDKPFFMYGHAAVINARHKELQEFLSNLTNTNAEAFLLRHNIRTVVLTESNQAVLLHYPALSNWMELIYMDPNIAILVKKGTITTEQAGILKHFYASFRPGPMDAMIFDRANRILQYVLLWFSAEMTGNSGEQYLSIASELTLPENLAKLKANLQTLVLLRRQSTP
jgi:hypothetical protein